LGIKIIKVINKCNWEAIHGFVSPGEFQRFCAWIENQVQSELAVEVEVNQNQLYFGNEQKWFKCKSSGEIWRLVAPEFPFRGLWAAIDVAK
jgi:hypothetical protein